MTEIPVPTAHDGQTLWTTMVFLLFAFFMVVKLGARQQLTPRALPWYRSIQGLEEWDPFGLMASN